MPKQTDPEHHVPDVVERFNKYGFRGSKQVVQMIWGGAFERFPKTEYLRRRSADRLGAQLARPDGQRIWPPAILGRTRARLAALEAHAERDRARALSTGDSIAIRSACASRAPELGIDKLMWASDFPHLESDWPNSRQVIEENFAKSTEDEIWKMTVGNAVDYFHLNNQ